MASKNIIAELNKGEKLNGDNWDIWHRKVQYILEEQDAIEPLTMALVEPEAGNTAQHRRDQEAYLSWKKKNSIARITLLSAMADDLMCEFETHRTAQAMWIALKDKFGGVSTTKLRRLTIKFDTYKLKPNNPMRQHLREMSTMIRELKEAGHNLSDEQQVQAVIRSLPASWEHMKVNLTHNENIITFNDVAKHLELEDERLEAYKATGQAYLTEGAGPSQSKPEFKKGKKFQKNGKKGGPPPKKGKQQYKKKGKKGGKKKLDLKKVKCFACHNMGHFARDCSKQTESGKVKVNYVNSHVSFVSSTVFLTEPVSFSWIIDSGSTDHVSRDRGSFVEYRRLPFQSKWLFVGNNARIEVRGIGTCKLVLRGGKTLMLHDVLHAPDIRRNLVSVICLLNFGFNVNFHGKVADIYSNSIFYGSAFQFQKFFILDLAGDFNVHDCFAITSNNPDMNIWHARLGHINQNRMIKLAKEGLLGVIPNMDMSLCESCLAGKATRKPFGKGTRAENPLQLIHSDICGPMSVRARHGAWYFITFIDDFSRYGHVYLISHKSEALECFRRYINEVENQMDNRIKALRTDRGREYLSDQFKQLCEEKGIIRQLTIPGTPQQNGVAERRNRTLLDMVRSMMAQANLPISHWGDALLTATFILNRVPSKSVASTPYELWTKRQPDLSILRPWGSAAYIHDSSHRHGKLGPRGKKCIFIRYSEPSKGYVFISEIEDGTVTETESRDAVFIETEFPSRGDVDRTVSLYETQEQDSAEQIDRPGSSRYVNLSGSQERSTQRPRQMRKDKQVAVAPTRKSNRESVPKRRFQIEGEALLVTPEGDDEPRTVHEALAGPAKEEWKKAMKEEMDSMMKNQVWELVDLPKGRKAIGNKWVLKIKRKVDGSIDKFKARLVAKGYTQQEGIDYEDTFSPVVRFNSIRLILAIVNSLNLELHQMDVKTAFLNGDLDEEIYMEQPIGFIEKGFEHKKCKLKRSIYGLKQSSRQWYLRFHKAITSYNFQMIEEDHCVYVKRFEGNFVILSLYVDDILLAGNSLDSVIAIKEWLSSNFEMKDMGEAEYILGVKIQRNRSKRILTLSQESYIKKILERFNMTECNPMDIPVATGVALSSDMCPKTDIDRKQMERVPYASAVGSLMYAMLCTRPDICYAVGLVSRFQSNPGEKHWKAVKRILRYLKGTSDYALCYQGSDLRLVGYSDADVGGDEEERRSTSGYTFLLNNGAICWSSKKQTCIALHSMEAEFVACTAAAQEAVWLKRFIEHLGFGNESTNPVLIHCDNTAAIAYTKDPKYHSKTKHIDIKYNFVRDYIAQKIVTVQYISTKCMVADPLTKPIGKETFEKHVTAIGMRKM